MSHPDIIGLNPAAVDYVFTRFDFVKKNASYKNKDFITTARDTVDKAKNDGNLGRAWSLVEAACGGYTNSEATQFMRQSKLLLPYANGDFRVIDRLLSYFGAVSGDYSSADDFLKLASSTDFLVPSNTVWSVLFPPSNWAKPAPRGDLFKIGDEEHIRSFEAFWGAMWTVNPSYTFLKMMDFGAPEYKSRDNALKAVTAGYAVVKTLLDNRTFDVMKTDMENDVAWQAKGTDTVTFGAGAGGYWVVTLKRTQVTMLKQMQDLVKLTGQPTMVAGLIINSLETKEKICATDRQTFITKVKSLPKAPVSSELAGIVYDFITAPPPPPPPPPSDTDSEPDSEPDQHKRVRKRDLTDPANPAALTSVDPNAGPTSSKPKHPTINELVGGTDLITLDDGCTTITSPAAYFVDLLELLKQHKATYEQSGGVSSKPTPLFDLLIARRPDLPFLQLSIENTMVELPYLDLVNEVMTQVIYAKAPGSKADPVYYDTEFGEHSKDLLAQPRHIDYDVYKYVSGAVPIGSLPYDPHLHRMRVLLRAMGTSLLNLMLSFPSTESRLGLETLQTADRDPLVQTEFLNISDEEVNLLLTQTPSGPAVVRKLWGITGNVSDASMPALLSDVKNQVLPRANIELEDLADILKTEYINPGAMRYNGNFNEDIDMVPGPIVIIDKGASGTPGLLPDMKLLRRDGSNLTWDDLLRLQIFTRVWKHINEVEPWTVDDLDCAFKLFAKPSGVDFDLTLGQISCISQIAKATGLDHQRVMVFFGDMSMSLYREIFVRHDLATKDPVFEWDKDKGLYLGDDTRKVGDHLPVILAALRIPSKDFPLLLKYLGGSEEDPLNFHTLSSYLRSSLLCEVFGVRFNELDMLKDFQSSFSSANTPIDLLRTFKIWQKLTKRTFNVEETIFISTRQDPDKLGMDLNDAVAISADLGAQLSSIESQYPDIVDSGNGDHGASETNSDVVSRYASLLFGSAMSKDIINFLEGRRVVRIPIDPPNAAPANFTDTQKLKLSREESVLVATGLLSNNELNNALNQGPSPVWKTALNSIRDLARDFYRGALGDILENEPDANDLETFFLQGDDTKPSDKDTEDKKSMATLKREKFLSKFIPLLRARLIRKAVNTFISNGVLQSMAPEIVRAVLQKPWASGSPDTIEDHLMAIRSDTYNPQEAFHGYLVPGTTDLYRFIADASSKPTYGTELSVIVDKTKYQFKPQFEGSKFLVTDLVSLSGGKTYEFMATAGIQDLQWRAQQTLQQAVPVASLIELSTRDTLMANLNLLIRLRLIIERLQLNLNEVAALDTNLSWQLMDYLMDYIDLREFIVSQNDKTSKSAVADKLLSIFPLRIDATNEPRYGAADISNATGWSLRDIRPYASFKSSDKVTWKSVLQIKAQLEICEKLGVLVNDVYRWTSTRDTDTVEDRQKRADELTLLYNNSPKISHEQWENTAAAAVYDELRGRHRKALVGFLLQQDWLENVQDADSLFEYLLIDTQMGAGLETSRIKQALSTIQLFVQRCILGCEANGTLRIQDIEKFIPKWDWMSKYRVWEANRKVFLFPENWIDPTLRDDKSSAFEAFESNLVKGTLTDENVTSAVLEYIHEAYDVRSLSIEATYTQRAPGSPPGDIESIHYFGRTVSAPYIFYHRVFSQITNTWTPWRKIDTPIAVIDHGADGVPLDRPGSFVVPYQYQGRMLLFLPQFLMKTSNGLGKDSGVNTSSNGDGTTHVNPPSRSGVTKYWEIKIGWTEFRNNKWSSKVLCPSTLEYKVNGLADIRNFRFCIGRSDELLGYAEGGVRSALESVGGKNTLSIYVDHANNHVGTFIWKNGGLETASFSGSPLSLGEGTISQWTEFHKIVGQDVKLLETSFLSRGFTVSSLPYQNDKSTLALPDVTHTQTLQEHKFQIRNALIPQLMPLQETKQIYKTLGVFGQGIGSTATDVERNEAFGALSEDNNSFSYPHELRTPAAIYNWELGFHIPAMIMDRAMSAQQFDIALKYGRFIFDPRPSSDDSWYWKWPPFAAFNPASSSITDKATVEEWKLNPFHPHVVARGRPLAYKKWVIMKYVEVLIAYGDFYFRQNTLESIPLAIQLYIEASHVFGPRGQYAPGIGRTQTDRYDDLQKFNFDALSNLKVDMAYTFPFAATGEAQYDDDTVLPLGAATSEYFKYYSNPKLVELRSLIDDRLTKIQNCMDINGVKRKLALFEPPMDPGALVAAMAQPGASLASVLGSMDSPMPNYRFQHILPKALYLCHELRKFSKLYITIRERGDAEALATLRASQYTAVQSIFKEMKDMEIQVARKEMEVAQDSLAAPQMRLNYYRALIGEPNTGNFQEITQSIERPSQGDNLRINSLEKDEHENHKKSMIAEASGEGLNFLTGILEALPEFSEKIQPFGMGVEIKIDAKNIAKISKYGAKAAAVVAKVFEAKSKSAARVNMYTARRQQRTLEANNAGYEIQNLKKQIELVQAKIQAAEHQSESQQKFIDQALEVQDFLRSKYTSEQLYVWLENSYKSYHYQAYNLAYDIAKRAEKAYQFECGDDSLSFIQYGYWEDGRSGLGCSEGLYMDLKRLEQAHLASKPYDYEIVKDVSLRDLQPLQLLLLRETGYAEFEIPELAYDLDFPGQYFRRIKTISVSVDCTVAPNTGVCCTLQLLEHKYRTKSVVKNPAQYAQQVPDAFRSDKIPIESVAISRGVNDSGMFELNFKDERFLPFEGAGAISKWSLEFPSEFRHFDYESIKDIVLHVRYTSKAGGGQLQTNAIGAAKKALKDASNGGLVALLDLRNDFPAEWAAFAVGTSSNKMSLAALEAKLPFFAQTSKAKATQVSILTSDTEIKGSQLTLASRGTTGQTFSDGRGGAYTNPDLKQFDLDFSAEMGADWSLTYSPNPARKEPLQMMWMAISYHLE